MIYGYARVSSKGQELYGNGLEVQEKVLREAGAEVIYSEAFTGTKRHRPELDKLLSVLKPGDTVIVHKLDRIARTAKEGLDIIDCIVDKGCTLTIQNMGTFDSSPMGKMIRTMFLGFAEFEHDMIMQRFNDGKEIARSRGTYHDGPLPMDVERLEEYQRLNRDGKITVKQACKELGISRSLWYKRVG